MNQASKNEKYYQNMSCISHTEHPKEYHDSLVIAPTVSTIFYIWTLWKSKGLKKLKLLYEKNQYALKVVLHICQIFTSTWESLLSY